MLRLSTIFLIILVWSAVVLPLEPCAAGDEDVDPFDVYAVDGSGEQLLHITVRPSGNQLYFPSRSKTYQGIFPT